MIRTIKHRLYRYFAEKQTMNWIDVIQKIVDGINRSKSSVHGLRPIDVNFKNAQQVWKKIYGNLLSTKKIKTKVKFKKDDYVRMSKDKSKMEKGYLPNFGDELLQIDVVKDQNTPTLYKLKEADGNKEKFKGSFYQEELTKVRKDAETTYRIEKVFKKRTRADGQKEFYVKFIGYPQRQWILESDLA